MPHTKDVAPQIEQKSVPQSFGMWRRWSARLQVLVGVVLAFYILLVVNLIAVALTRARVVRGWSALHD